MGRENAEKHRNSKKNGKAATSAGGARKTAAELARVTLTQDPHAIRDTREKVLEVAIGHEVRAFRKKLGITVADVPPRPIFRSAAVEDRERQHIAVAHDFADAVAGARRADHRLLPPFRGGA